MHPSVAVWLGARLAVLVGIGVLAACGSSAASSSTGGADADVEAGLADSTAPGDDAGGRDDASSDAGASDATAHSDGGLVSCAGQSDGTTIAGGQLCCGGFPIPPTANGRCPALFHGNATGVSAAPVVGAAATASGRGYWLVARDGGVFTYGDATFYGSLGGKGVNDVVGIATDPAGTGSSGPTAASSRSGAPTSVVRCPATASR